MPLITATPLPTRGQVVVMVDWSDVNEAVCTRVYRVRVDTGERLPLHPYVYPCPVPGEFQMLSGGRAIFWDNEAPLGTPFYYLAEAAEYALIDHSVHDSFSRGLGEPWGEADSGQVWAAAAGSQSILGTPMFTPPGRVGGHNVTTVLTEHVSTIPEMMGDVVSQATVATEELSTGASNAGGLLHRYGGLSQYYSGRVQWRTDGTTELVIVKRFGGIDTTIVGPTASGLSYVALERHKVKMESVGTTHRMKTWKEGTAEPAGWLVTVVDADIDIGEVGGRSIQLVGNTNGSCRMLYDDYSALPTGQMIELRTADLTLDSLGGGWLRDPLRPCHDRRIVTCWPKQDPVCVPGSGIMFVSLGPESYDANGAAVLPTNARRPIAVNRTRRDADTVLSLVPRLFTDRDALLETVEPGSPLLFSTLAQYGLPDRYMDVDTVDVTRYKSDHRYQPRLVQLPYTTVDQPVGTQQGACGTQFADQCDLYDSWSEMVTADLSWGQMVTGESTGVDLGTVDWDAVEAGFANWTAVVVGNTWDNVKFGT